MLAWPPFTALRGEAMSRVSRLEPEPYKRAETAEVLSQAIEGYLPMQLG